MTIAAPGGKRALLAACATERARVGRSSVGSWVTYGLGSENEDLPAYMVMLDGPTKAGPPAYGAGFLPAVYQWTVLRG